MEFDIPMDKDDLLKVKADKIYLRELIPVRNISQALDGTRINLEKKGPRYIFMHFNDFFSIIVHGKKLEHSVILRAFDRIVKSTTFIIKDLIDKADYGRVEMLSIVKMHVYILSQLMCYLEDTTIEPEASGKKKKGQKKSDTREEWEIRREKALLVIYELLQQPLQQLWEPPIVEDAFVMLVADICYKILEQNKDKKNTIWQILGTLVKKYVHTMACTIRIIQLVKMDGTLAVSLAAGVASMVTDHQCPTFINEIAREIEQGRVEEAEARNIASFMEAISAKVPEIMLRVLDNIIGYFDNECYVMRNCAIGILENVIHDCLTSENLSQEKREKRNECFHYLLTHMLDVNAYVRSKVFQTWQKLSSKGALPHHFTVRLLKAVVPHLGEKSTIIRKQALQLLRSLLQSNHFGPSLDKENFIKKRNEVEEELRQIQASVVTESKSGDEERIAFWQEVAPQLQEVIKKMLDDKENDRESDEQSNDTEEIEDDGELNVDEEFEKIRQLILDREYSQAFQCLEKVCEKCDYSLSLADMHKDEKEYCFLMFFLKIFLESQQDREKDEAKFQSVAWKKRIEKIKKSKQLMIGLELAIVFITEMEQAIPIIERMIYAAAAPVALEACTFLGVAYKFNITGATTGIRKALAQVFSRDESVKNNVAIVYKEIYLTAKQNNLSSRHKVITSVNSLIDLFKGLQEGQSPALLQLITMWNDSSDLTEEHIQVMWEKFSFKIVGTTIDDSRSAIALLTMIGHSQPKLIINNLKTLIKIGLQTHGKEHLLLARDTCRALMKIHQDSDDSLKEPIRYLNNHEVLEEIQSLLIDSFETSQLFVYVSFATDAINVIYHLANQPHLIIKNILQLILRESVDDTVTEAHLAKLLYLVGHICIRQMVHLDTAVYKELKRRNALRDQLKGKNKNKNKNRESVASAHESASKARRSIHRNKSMLQEETYEEESTGVCADDADAESIDVALENTIVTGNGFLAQFVPLVTEVCQYPERYKLLETQAWGVLALTKMMTVSSEFCKQNLQLLITILEKSTHPEIRSNILIGLSDLMIRFPNEVEPWTAHIYARLRDNEVLVRKTAMRVLTNLVKREMIRVKGQMSEMALCIMDADENIQNDAKQFFQELSQKGNVLYNILPDILSRLTSESADVDEDNLHKILKYILSLLHKEREIDALLDKICTRFRLATTERQWRDLSYCLTLLPYGKKGIIKLTSKLPLLKEKIQNKQVYRALREIIEMARKKPDTKEVCDLLEDEIEKLIEARQENPDAEKDRVIMPPPLALPKKRLSRRKKIKSSSSDDDDDDDDDDDNSDDESEENDDNDQTELAYSLQTPKSSLRKKAKQITKTSRKRSNHSNLTKFAGNTDHDTNTTPNEQKQKRISSSLNKKK